MPRVPLLPAAAAALSALPAHAAVCASCDLVPCGHCQQGCPPSHDGCGKGTSRNACPNRNKGYWPPSCLPPASPPPPTPTTSFCSEAGWAQAWSD
eukprot:gene21148-54157_t